MHLPVIRTPSSVQDASAFIRAPSALTILQLQPAIRDPSSVPDVHACHLGYIHATRQSHRMHLITKTRPCNIQYRDFLSCKNLKYLVEFFRYFSYFCSKHRLCVYVRTASENRLAEAVLTSTHNLCFGATIRNRYTPANPSFDI